MNNSAKILFVLAAGWLTTTAFAQDRIHYTGKELSNPACHDGQLSPVVGVHNIQLVRANREHPDASNGNGWTYNHQPMLAYWNGQFFYQYLADPSDEHVPPSQTFLMTSKDGYRWTNPEIVFPPYQVPDGYTKESRPGVQAKDLIAIMHQRVGFYVSKSGKLITMGNYGVALDKKDDPNDGNGIGRVVREIKKDGSFGPIYFIYYNHGFNEKNTDYPYFKKSKDREYWVKTMIKIIDPLYTNLSQNTLRKNMPVETFDGLNNGNTRKNVTHLEALGRSFDGISAWLNLPPDDTEEGQLRAKYTNLVVKSIANAVNPESPDYMRFDGPGGQPLVDAAFFAQGLLRSKDQIWPKLDKVTQERIIKELKASRRIKASESNWLMFSATIEAALLEFTGECDLKPIHYALKRHKEWYKGDGWYGDGRNFHLDYYNSYVIQPMLIDVLAVMKEHKVEGADFYDVQLQRLIRYADQQEKMISPEGTYPVLGRSMGYRFGAFQVLAQVSWMKLLPEHIKPAQVRCALTKVMKRQLAKGTFDKDGWLNLGFCGHQPEIADRYVSTGSNYLCTFIFLPLGLQADDEFWTAKPEKWSSVKIWSGSRDIKKDGSIRN